jgi:hypothetical protein
MTWWFTEISTQQGDSRLQVDSAPGQRSQKRHPSGGVIRLGVSPGMDFKLFFSARVGKDEKRA